MKTDIKTEHLELEAAAAMYRFLARAFLEEPTTAVLTQLQSGEQGQLLKAMGYDFLDGLDGYAPAEQEEMLAVEYCRLFIGPGQHISPHEGRILGEDQHWGERTASVYAAYREAGFDLERNVHEMPDHVGVQFSFVAQLIESEMDCRRQGRQNDAVRFRKQKHGFLKDHLARWIPSLAQEVAERSELGFYKNLAFLTRDWMDSEMAEAINDAGCVRMGMRSR